jgi:hypothetical protein
MSCFFTGSCLSEDGLTLKLTNDLGYSKDAAVVDWTIFSIDGEPISGLNLPASKSKTGEYYAPWQARKSGDFVIKWNYKEDFGGLTITKSQNFFIVDPNNYVNGFVIGNGAPRGGGAFLTGQVLGRGDLPLYIKDEDGLPADAFSVCWTILNVVGRAVSSKNIANRYSLGEYFASFFVNQSTGNYSILWEYQETSTSPITSVKQDFCVVNPLAPCSFPVVICSCSVVTTPCAPKPCPPSFLEVFDCQIPIFPPYLTTCASQTINTVPFPICRPVVSSQCCPFEIERVVHLAPQILPIGNIFTNQSQYVIPTGVRTIAFYITYTRGAVGGFTVLRLFWGNGVEEVQSTLIMENVNQITTALVSQDMFVDDFKGPVPTDNNSICFLLETTPPGGSKTVRLRAAEGSSGTPGSISITLTASG